MLRALMTVLILVIPAALHGADKPTASDKAKPATAEKSVEAEHGSEKDSPLVRAAKASKARKTQKSIVITDADVKKSTGRLTVISSRELPKVEEPSEEAPSEKAPVVDAQVAKSVAANARDEARARYQKAQQEVDALMRELQTAEEEYYNEDDATIRDQVIEARFDRAKRQLDAAREELASAREALAKLGEN